MLGFIASRLAAGVMVIAAVATITFFLLRVLPGGPFDTDKSLPPIIKENIERKYGLDLPLWRQYARYVSDLARGEFGPSYKYMDRTVGEIIRDTLPVSLRLGAAALVVSVILGISLGALSSLRPGGPLDVAGLTLSTALVSVPSFVVGALLVYVAAVKWRILPAALWGTPAHYVLPTVTLAAGPAAYIARLVRNTMVEVSASPFIVAVRARGVGTTAVVLKHILKNALVPVITVLGPIAAYLVTGSFVVEEIFEIPGMGRFFVTAVSNRDYPLVMGITVVYTVVLVVANLLVDLCYVVVDPRMRIHGTDRR